MTLVELLSNLDASVRIAAIEAHRRMLGNLAKTPPKLGDRIPSDALIPRDMLAPEKVELELPVRVRDDDFSLRATGRGRRGQLRVRWRAVEAPEALALIRTSAELMVSRRIEGSWPIKENNDG